MNKVAHDSETPAHGQQAISVCAFIHQDFDGVTKVFLPKRAATKKFLPGIYELPGGHVDFGEDLIPALKREIQEEFGMTITVGEPFAAFTYQNMVKGCHTVEIIYFATFAEPFEHIRLNPEDHSMFKWFSRGEVINNSADIIPSDNVTHHLDEGDDPEYQTILTGFELLAKASS